MLPVVSLSYVSREEWVPALGRSGNVTSVSWAGFWCFSRGVSQAAGSSSEGSRGAETHAGEGGSELCSTDCFRWDLPSLQDSILTPTFLPKSSLWFKNLALGELDGFGSVVMKLVYLTSAGCLSRTGTCPEPWLLWQLLFRRGPRLEPLGPI